MARAFCIPGIVFLFCALVLSFLASVSLPYLPALDITRIHFGNGVTSGQDGITQIRFGVWAHCEYDQNESRTCSKVGHGYTVGISGVKDKNLGVIIGPSWTRGLAVHPVATGVTFIALLLSFSTHVTVTLLSSLASFFAATITLIAFAIDIALYAYVRHQVAKLPDVFGRTKTAPGFWLTFISLILLLMAGCTVCFGRRKERMSGSTSYPMTSTYTTKKPIWARFRRK